VRLIESSGISGGPSVKRLRCADSARYLANVAHCQEGGRLLKAVLIRVGIDATAGGWNAPVNPHTLAFVYVPIPDEPRDVRPGLRRVYKELVSPLADFGMTLPSHLAGGSMHLDPDFDYLTYGDVWPRSAPITQMGRGDVLVFYAGLRPLGRVGEDLIYAIIGYYVVDEVVQADSIPAKLWVQNAHTRRKNCEGDHVVRACKGQSGRLKQCIPIGEYRDRAYRVRKDLLTVWGGLTVKDGFIQRSGRLPSFLSPEMFIKWFQRQDVELMSANN
jgi:hypothetical protein